jgi:hypothetical protein
MIYIRTEHPGCGHFVRVLERIAAAVIVNAG